MKFCLYLGLELKKLVRAIAMSKIWDPRRSVPNTLFN